jgi:hypothetical protein
LKHRAVLDKIKWCGSLSGNKWSRFTWAFQDALNQGIRDAQRNPVPTPHGVYIDDNIYLDITDKHHFKKVTATSIKAIFILLGGSNIALCHDPISWDKLHELLVAPVNRVLGLILNLCCTTAGSLPDIIASTINLLRSTWAPHRQSFKVKEAEELTGKLNHIAFGTPWLKYFLGNIYSSLAAALRLNKLHLVRTSSRFNDALCEIRTAPA